jgi:hypothetical protein
LQHAQTVDLTTFFAASIEGRAIAGPWRLDTLELQPRLATGTRVRVKMLTEYVVRMPGCAAKEQPVRNGYNDYTGCDDFTYYYQVDVLDGSLKGRQGWIGPTAFLGAQSYPK